MVSFRLKTKYYSKRVRVEDHGSSIRGGIPVENRPRVVLEHPDFEFEVCEVEFRVGKTFTGSFISEFP